MMEKERILTNQKTTHSGYHLGIRRKVNATPDEVWERLQRLETLQLWLPGLEKVASPGSADETRSAAGIFHWKECERSVLLSFRYKEHDWPGWSNVKIRVIGHQKDHSLIHILQENIPDLSCRGSLSERLCSSLTDAFFNED